MLVGRKGPRWVARRTLPEDEYKKILGNVTPYTY
jgi:hypothetical protein